MMSSAINVEKTLFCSPVTCFFFIIAALSTVQAENENPTTYAPLPKPSEYNLHAADTGENGLLDIAYGIANILRDKPPYDIINNVLTSKTKSITTNQVMDYEAPIIGLMAISLVFAIAIPIVSIVVCICRFAGKCGGDMEINKDLDIRPTKKRKRFTLAIVLSCVFLVSGSILIFVSSNGMTSSLQKTRKTVHYAFDDIFIYKNNTFQELNHILGSDVLQVLQNIINKVAQLGLNIVSPIISNGTSHVDNLVDSINKLDTALNKSVHLLEDINDNVQTLVSEAVTIQNKLEEAKTNISKATKNCTSACHSVPDGNDLNTDANFTQVPNINETIIKTQKVVNSNLTDEANKGKANFKNLSSTVQDLATNFTSDIKNFSRNLEDIKIDVLKPWEDKIDEMLNENLLPYKDDIDGYLRPGSNLILYDNYRNIIYIVSGVMVLLVVSLALLGLILGMVGASTFDTPSTRGDLSDTGGRILIGSAGFAVFTAFLINLVVAAVFLVGVNTAIVCRAMPDYELLKNTVDSPNVRNVFSLSKLIFNESQSQNSLTFTSLLTDCGKRKGLWTAMHLDQSLYNLTSALDFKDKIPKIDTVFKEINETVLNTPVMTAKARQSINDSSDAGIQNINFTKFNEQTNKSIVTVSLSKFADNLTRAANNTQGEFKKKLEGIADDLMNLENTTVNSSQFRSEKVKDYVEKLMKEAKVIVKTVKEIERGLEKVEHFLKINATVLARQGIEKYANAILEDVDHLVKHVISKVHNDVGRCHPINNIYQSLTTAVCRDYFGNLNTSWIGFGLCTLFTLITIILCVRAAKHFRRVHLSDTIKDSDKWDSKIEMPWDAGFEMKDQLIN